MIGKHRKAHNFSILNDVTIKIVDYAFVEVGYPAAEEMKFTMRNRGQA